MLVKLESGGYYDAATGREIVATESREKDWRVVIRNSSHVIERVVCSGYRDEAEAQSALDELLAPEDVLRIALPEPIEETTVEEDSETVEEGTK